jgi:hypothetical protein
MAEENGIREPRTGHYLPGNPSGRAGSTSQPTQTRVLIEPNRRSIIARAPRLMRSTNGRDAAAGINILLGLLSPIPSPEREKVNLPGLAIAVSLREKCDVIIAGVAQGSISAEAAEKLLKLVDLYRSAITADNHEYRLRRLEGKDVPAERVADDCSDLA